jgi:hypothetical protein
VFLSLAHSEQFTQITEPSEHIAPITHQSEKVGIYAIEKRSVEIVTVVLCDERFDLSNSSKFCAWKHPMNFIPRNENRIN